MHSCSPKHGTVCYGTLCPMSSVKMCSEGSAVWSLTFKAPCTPASAWSFCPNPLLLQDKSNTDQHFPPVGISHLDWEKQQTVNDMLYQNNKVDRWRMQRGRSNWRTVGQWDMPCVSMTIGFISKLALLLQPFPPMGIQCYSFQCIHMTYLYNTDTRFSATPFRGTLSCVGAGITWGMIVMKMLLVIKIKEHALRTGHASHFDQCLLRYNPLFK